MKTLLINSKMKYDLINGYAYKIIQSGNESLQSN
jgi:hypothetical protein